MNKKSNYEYNSKYAKKYLGKFDDIKIRVPAGEKQQWKNTAEQRGKSLNQYVIDLVHEDMQKQKDES